jgi:signal transduction histidine kinase
MKPNKVINNFIYNNLPTIETSIFGAFTAIFGFWVLSIIYVFGNATLPLMLISLLLCTWFIISEQIKSNEIFSKAKNKNIMLVLDTIIFGVLINIIIYIFQHYGAPYSDIDFILLLPAISIPLYYSTLSGLLSLLSIYLMHFLIHPHTNAEMPTVILQFTLYVATYLLVSIVNKKKDKFSESTLSENKALLQLDKDKDRFIATAAHELKRPITVVNGYLDLLNDDTLNPKQRKEFLQKALIASQDMGHLSRRLLSLNQIQLGKLQVSKEYFDPRVICNRIIDNFRICSDKENIKFFIDDDKCRTSIYADKELVSEVIMNLLNNSLKFTDKGKIGITILGGLDETIFTISDTGAGISKADQKRVFGKFYQGKVAKASLNGLGIGLFLCKEIIRAHNGKIWIESEVGKGTNISFSIPK